MGNFETNLSRAISICDGSLTYCNQFSRIYTFTTENISGYLKYFDFKDKSLLTVGSSGDQILNAYFNGARDITLYDVNSYCKYYIYLKIAAILCLDYNEFQEFFFRHGLDDYYNKNMFCKEIFDKIKPTLRLLDYESFLFFDELFCLFDKKKIRDNLFNDDEYRNRVIKSFNIYLRNEVTYNKLKSIVGSIDFKYVEGDIFSDNIDGKFDNIFLSNLCTISDISKLKGLFEKLDRDNLKVNGRILLGYLWDIKFSEDYFYEDWSEIYKMPRTRERLKEYITEHYSIKSDRDFLWESDSKSDLVLIYRKKDRRTFHE